LSSLSRTGGASNRYFLQDGKRLGSCLGCSNEVATALDTHCGDEKGGGGEGEEGHQRKSRNQKNLAGSLAKPATQ